VIEKKPLVLILCTGNSCRSQMAEGFLRKYQGDKFEVASAGVEPRPQMHPMAVQVMAEAGVDISSHSPKSLLKFLGKAPVRYLLIVCNSANGTCPRLWPGTYTRAYVPFDDPAEAQGTEEERLAVFRRVRDEIEALMKVWQPAVAPTERTTPH
jgi:arsenate reductase